MSYDNTVYGYIVLWTAWKARLYFIQIYACGLIGNILTSPASSNFTVVKGVIDVCK